MDILSLEKIKEEKEAALVAGQAAPHALKEGSTHAQAACARAACGTLPAPRATLGRRLLRGGVAGSTGDSASCQNILRVGWSLRMALSGYKCQPDGKCRPALTPVAH